MPRAGAVCVIAGLRDTAAWFRRRTSGVQSCEGPVIRVLDLTRDNPRACRPARALIACFWYSRRPTVGDANSQQQCVLVVCQRLDSNNNAMIPSCTTIGRSPNTAYTSTVNSLGSLLSLGTVGQCLFQERKGSVALLSVLLSLLKG